MTKISLIGLFVTFVFFFSGLYGNEPSLKNMYKRGYINLERVMEINNDSFENNLYLKNFNYYTIAQSGNIYISDKSGNKIVFLDSKGKFIKTIGQTGQGPGDLNYPLNICSNNNQLIVYEMRNRRYSIFKLDSTFLKNVKSDSYRILDIFSLKNSEYIFWVQKFSIEEKNPQDHIKIIHSSKNLEVKKVLFKRQIFLNKYVGYENFPQPFAPSLLCSVNTKDDIILGFQSDNHYNIIKPDGSKIKINHKMKKKVIKKYDKEDFFAGINFFDGRVLKKGASEGFRKATSFPSHKPYYKVLKTDLEDNILLFEYPENGRENTFYVFTSSGKFINRVVIKNTKLKFNGIRFQKGGFLFCDGLDEDEEPFLAKYKIR